MKKIFFFAAMLAFSVACGGNQANTNDEQTAEAEVAVEAVEEAAPEAVEEVAPEAEPVVEAVAAPEKDVVTADKTPEYKVTTPAATTTLKAQKEVETKQFEGTTQAKEVKKVESISLDSNNAKESAEAPKLDSKIDGSKVKKGASVGKSL